MSGYDVAVIGGGAAGLSGALVLARARRAVAVVDSGEPRNAPAAHLHGFLSRDGMPPTELLAAGRAELARYGTDLLPGTVSEVSATSDAGFDVVLVEGRRLRARRILVATGLRDALPDIPGARERWGRDLLHCPYCHGYEVRDEPLGVLGGTPGAVEHALLVRQWSADVVYFSGAGTPARSDRERLVARGITVVDGGVRRLVVENDHLTGVELVDGSVVRRTAVFVRPGFVPNSDLLVRLGGAVTPEGWVHSDPTGRTSVAGVWVAGNAVDPRAQVITAAGQGSAAAIALNADLVEEDARRALPPHGRADPLFETPRLRARRFTRDDLEAFVAYRRHPDVERFQSWSDYTVEQGRSLIASLDGKQPGVPGEWFQIALEERSTGVLVGDVALRVDADEPHQAEIGFTLAPTQQGKGYATEAVRALLDHIFGTLGLHRVIAVTDAHNAPAATLLQRVGMRREAHFVEAVFFKGSWGSELVFAMLGREWRAPRH
jgi:thioredoxin reductase/RimJ/RimL family protein N-acetyltransferase